MQPSVRTRILELTGADDIDRVELIQPLWNNYGTLSRVHLQGGEHRSVIVKHIQIPEQAGHPRGFGGAISKQRKIRSYQVETHWYQHQNGQVSVHSPTPRCLDAFDHGNELFLLLEDLGTRGFDEVLYGTSWSEITVGLHWLAHFHAQFIGASAEGLWPTGTYWHLATRPEELTRIEGTRLHQFAGLLDARLRCGGFSTIIHGDAKLANFLFSADHAGVAAVDFQYVGRGCAMQDVAYFIGSCLSGAECERQEIQILDIYFAELRSCLSAGIDGDALEIEWRSLYPVAWADFQRFMTGWSPQHRKLTDYSDATTERAIEGMTTELLDAARTACLAAGQYIQAHRNDALDVGSKGFATEAADVVTHIDLQAQAMILEHLQPTMERYDLGLLAEEGHHDDSRLRAHAFWTIDPLDGTKFFIDGLPGYTTSIALVSQDGEPILGAVYDPVRDHMYEAVLGQGVTLNGEPLITTDSGADGPTAWYADRSLKNESDFQKLQAEFDIQFVGGAVMNVLQLLTKTNCCYLKRPKKDLGGCAIWDLAAVTLMLRELGGKACFFDGRPLQLNRSESIYFNDVGLCFASADVDVSMLLGRTRS